MKIKILGIHPLAYLVGILIIIGFTLLNAKEGRFLEALLLIFIIFNIIVYVVECFFNKRLIKPIEKIKD